MLNVTENLEGGSNPKDPHWDYRTNPDWKAFLDHVAMLLAHEYIQAMKQAAATTIEGVDRGEKVKGVGA